MLPAAFSRRQQRRANIRDPSCLRPSQHGGRHPSAKDCSRIPKKLPSLGSMTSTMNSSEATISQRGTVCVNVSGTAFHPSAKLVTSAGNHCSTYAGTGE